MDDTEIPRLRLRIVFAPQHFMGPGKAELLEGIKKTGSIAAAGRQMGMSYKRAWQLVEAMNAMFAEPLVLSSRGGAKGGGAEVTDAGNQVLRDYRALESRLRDTGKEELDRLISMLAVESDVPEGE